MEAFAVKPYEGSRDYIFISCCRDDADAVYPVIEQMVRDGCRVWYDSGVTRPGTAAERLNSCSLCLTFLSERFINSPGCMSEMNTALASGKPLLAVTMEELNLPEGLTEEQILPKHTMTDREFFGRLYSSPQTMATRTAPAIRSAAAESAEPSAKNSGKKKKRLLIPLISAFVALAAVLGVIAFAANQLGFFTPRTKVITDIRVNCSGLIASVGDMEVAYNGYSYLFREGDSKDNRTAPEGVVLHSQFTPSLNSDSTEYYPKKANLYRDNTLVDDLKNNSRVIFDYDRTLAIALPYTRSELVPGEYHLDLGEICSDSAGASGDFSIFFTVEEVPVSKTGVSFTLNESNPVALEDHIGETIQFYNGQIIRTGGYYLTFDSVTAPNHMDKFELTEDTDGEMYLGKNISGQAKVLEKKINGSVIKGHAVLQITKLYEASIVYMPNLRFLPQHKDKKILTGLDLKYDIVRATKPLCECDDDTVIRQDIQPGTKVVPGTVVTLTLYGDDAEDSPEPGILTPTPYSDIFPENLLDEKESPAIILSDNSCRQLLSITLNGSDSKAHAVLCEQVNGRWSRVTYYRATVAKNGIAKAKEGSPITPEGIFRLGQVLTAENPDTKMKLYPATENTCIVDDEKSPLYNNIMEKNDVPEGTHIDPIGIPLTKPDTTNAVIFIEFNGNDFSREGVVAGSGSAIGICGQYGELKPTNGSIEISADDMKDLLSRLDASLNPMIEITSGSSVRTGLLNRSDDASPQVIFQTDQDLLLSSEHPLPGSLLEYLQWQVKDNEVMNDAYRIDFLDNGKSTVPKEPVRLFIPCSDPQATLYYYDGLYNSATEIDAIFYAGYLVFETADRGIYLVAGDRRF